MSANTGIEWTDATWNPIRGCSRVSEGCRNCYAEKVAYRFSGEGQPYEGLVRFREVRRTGVEPPEYERVRLPEWNGQVRFVEEHLLDPLQWKKSRRIFVNSMSDLFHENVQDEWIDRIFAVMALCPQHTFQILTKRPERMLKYLSYHYRVVSPGPREMVYGVIQGAPGYDHEHPKWLRTANAASSLLSAGPLPNVWLGTSVENQEQADKRIPLLLQTPAAVRFISAEPLLGSVNLHPWFCEDGDREKPEQRWCEAICTPSRKIDWVICGGESGSGARPMHPDWARSLRDQCRAAGVPFFKQWGEWLQSDKPVEARSRKTGDFQTVATRNAFLRVGKKAAGALLDGREWREFPAVSA